MTTCGVTTKALHWLKTTLSGIAAMGQGCCVLSWIPLAIRGFTEYVGEHACLTEPGNYWLRLASGSGTLLSIIFLTVTGIQRPAVGAPLPLLQRLKAHQNSPLHQPSEHLKRFRSHICALTTHRSSVHCICMLSRNDEPQCVGVHIADLCSCFSILGPSLRVSVTVSVVHD